MKNLCSRACLVVALFVLAPVALLAQVSGQGIMLGNWKLNVAKSDFGDGAKLMAMAVKMTSDTPELIEFAVNQTTGSGYQGSYSFTGATDGKEYPITGSATVYSYVEEPGVVHETQRDPDGTVTKGDFTLSPNGKVGIWLYTITNPDGTVVKQKLVFDRAA
ncbi:MAG: hypothetical protein ABSE51_22825 [Terracidiphilus sp.]|jgi:hypothetical protein